MSRTQKKKKLKAEPPTWKQEARRLNTKCPQQSLHTQGKKRGRPLSAVKIKKNIKKIRVLPSLSQSNGAISCNDKACVVVAERLGEYSIWRL